MQHIIGATKIESFTSNICKGSAPYNNWNSFCNGMIVGDNNEKMSKSRGNVLNPDDIVEEFGADSLRTYEMFIGAFELNASWSNQGVKACRRFLDRVWRLQANKTVVREIYIPGKIYNIVIK